MRLEGKVALISGAARGQGETEARLFAQEGASVVLGDILESEGEAAAAAIRENGRNARFIALDVTSEDAWISAVRFTVETFGRLDILINNAAIYARTLIVDTDIEEWRRIMDITTPFDAGNALPTAIWSDGTTMWVVDGLASSASATNIVVSSDLIPAGSSSPDGKSKSSAGFCAKGPPLSGQLPVEMRSGLAIAVQSSDSGGCQGRADNRPPGRRESGPLWPQSSA